MPTSPPATAGNTKNVWSGQATWTYTYAGKESALVTVAPDRNFGVRDDSHKRFGATSAALIERARRRLPASAASALQRQMHRLMRARIQPYLAGAVGADDPRLHARWLQRERGALIYWLDIRSVPLDARDDEPQFKKGAKPEDLVGLRLAEPL